MEIQLLGKKYTTTELLRKKAILMKELAKDTLGIKKKLLINKVLYHILCTALRLLVKR